MELERKFRELVGDTKSDLSVWETEWHFFQKGFEAAGSDEVEVTVRALPDGVPTKIMINKMEYERLMKVSYDQTKAKLADAENAIKRMVKFGGPDCQNYFDKYLKD